MRKTLDVFLRNNKEDTSLQIDAIIASKKKECSNSFFILYKYILSETKKTEDHNCY
jgi:hypothetical protein